MKLFLHIGTPKTASTYLQNTCAANPDWLARNGILYPDLMAPDPNHITLFYASAVGIHDFARDYGLNSQEDVQQFRGLLSDSIARQIEDAPDHIGSMLMSSENLTGNLRNIGGIKNLASLLKPHFDDTRIILYLRRQDDAILSMYGEFMRRGFTGMTFDQFFKTCLGSGTFTPYLYYRRVLNMWIKAFGQEAISVRLFEKPRLRQNDILADFMGEILGTEDPDLEGLIPSPDDNVGLSAPVLEFLRRMHAFVPNRKDKVVNPHRIRLADKINALPAQPRPRMSATQSQKIMTHFQGANTWLQATFFPDHDGPLFPPRTDLEEEGNLGKVTLKEFAQFTGELLT